jgi:hypothetical protein
MMRFGFGGRPPRFPLALAAVALASDVAFPPFRPRLTAAGFLATGIVLVALDGQFREALGDLVHLRPVALVDGDPAGFHQVLAAGLNGCGGGVSHHVQNYTEPLGLCQVGSKRQLGRQQVA